MADDVVAPGDSVELRSTEDEDPRPVAKLTEAMREDWADDKLEEWAP